MYPYTKCALCGHPVGHEFKSYRRVDEPTKFIDGKVIKGKKKFYHLSCYNKVMNDLKDKK